MPRVTKIKIMSSSKRIKLHVSSGSSGNNRRSWFLFDPEKCRIVSDLSYLIAKRFGLGYANVILQLDGYFLPPSENIDIVRDNDSITVSDAPSNNVNPQLLNVKEEEIATLQKTVKGEYIYGPVTVMMDTSQDGCINGNGLNIDSSGSSSSSDGDSSTESSSSSTSEENVDDFFMPKTESKNKTVIASKPVNAKSADAKSTKITPKVAPLKTNPTPTAVRPMVKLPRPKKRPNSATKSTPAKSPKPSSTAVTKTGSGMHIRFNESTSSSTESEDNKMEGVSKIDTKPVKIEKIEQGRFLPLDLNSVQLKVGDRLKYKILELSSDYTPSFSVYKEGSVTSFNLSKQTVALLLSSETVDREEKRLQESCAGKFSLTEEMDEDCVDKYAEVNLSEMVEPLIYVQE